MNLWLAVGLGAANLAVLAVALWLLLSLVRQSRRLVSTLASLEQRVTLGAAAVAPSEPAPSGPGLPAGAPAPAFQLPGLHGELLTLDALRAPGTPVLLTFVDPGCGPCNALLPDLARWQRELAGKVTLALVSGGSPEENRAKAQGLGIAQVLVQQSRAVSNAYQAYGTPSMVLVRADGTIGSPVAQGAEQIRSLVARMLGTPPAAVPVPSLAIPLVPAPVAVAPSAAGQPCPSCGKVHDPAPAAPAGLSLGQAAPALSLPDLDGRTITLESYRGRDVVVLFWNPGCGFCQQLLPQLKQWEASRPPAAPALLVVSSGDAAANRALGLQSPLVLQESFQTGATFGANGTPSAVLVNRNGMIASAPAVGGPAVLALLGAPSAVAG